MEEFMYFLQGRMTTPKLFGWFHILCIVLMIALCVVIYIFRKKISPKAVNIIVLCTGIAIILLEVYKQLIFSFNYNGGNGNSYWDFQWYAFPYQFCSTPMYIMVLAGILRKGKIHDALYCYLATFALFAGLVVMCYPGDVFMSYIGINIQTMVCHGGMFVVGFLILATRSIEFNLRSILKATIVFVIMLVIALLMNIIWHYCSTSDETFNMFYISPYFHCTLPLLSIIYDKTPYVVFLLVYVVGFMLAASIMMGFAILFDKIGKRIFAKKNSEIYTAQPVKSEKKDE